MEMKKGGKFMKKIFYLIIVVLLGFVFFGLGNNTPTRSTVVYEDVTLSGGFQSGHFPEVWDLTACDLVISFTYDANGLVDDYGGDAHAWSELGVRMLGYGDFNPTWDVEGAGVWLATDYDWTINTFDPDPPGYPTLDLDDKLILQKAGGHGEGDYNLPSAPLVPWNNHRVWWDRDGVDPWQNDETANTAGICHIEISLKHTSYTSGEAYMTINGLAQGFEIDGKWNTIELSPAGMTFSGDMTKMQVFYGLYGYGATHSVDFKKITVTGCLGTIVIDGCDTGVKDRLVDNGKSSISQKIDKCAESAKNHGEFVSCVAHLTNELQKAGIITGKEKGAIQSCAAQANIPK
jgi:hypothetical protein